MRKVAFILSLILFMGFGALTAQTKDITGNVVDDLGEAIPGVSIVVKGTTVGTVTRFDGSFLLNVPSEATNLIFSFVGMESKDVLIADKSVINVTLGYDTEDLDEVVVTALGVSRDKKSLGYAVQEVSSEEIGKTGNANLATAMQGKLAGVDIKPSSGMPGASSQIVIRGARSFTGDNTPLYVVDGQPIESTSPYSTGNSVTGADIANRAVDINPADIESINILKGQAAAALYGIRASNGVVIITTKSGSGNSGAPVVSINHTSSFDVVSRSPDYQTTYAQGSSGAYVPNSSMAWGPKISDLPNDPIYGGNGNGYDGMYRVPQLEQAGMNPWVTPQVYDNFGDYFGTGYTSSTNVSVGQSFDDGNFIISLGQTDQTGIAPNTGMNKWNAKIGANKDLNNNFKTGFTANYVKSEIDKLSGANDAALAGVYAAPLSYDLKGISSSSPIDPYAQIYYRGLTFDNPYWVKDNNTFNEATERFYGNGFIQYLAELGDGVDLNVKYQLGTDTYTSHYQDIFGYGSNGGAGRMYNYGVTQANYNSLLTANINWAISSDLKFNAVLGNEINHTDIKKYSQDGFDFNFGGWNHINNTKSQTVTENQRSTRTVGFFGSASLDYRSRLYLNVTARQDIDSRMPSGNRAFFYPSVSLGFVASEISALKDVDWLSFAKVRLSYAEVGQAGDYYEDYYSTPTYSGSWWKTNPINYPLSGGINSYEPYSIKYDPNLKPQNTKSYEFGIDLKFLNNRLGVDYTHSVQDVTDQIFNVPLSGSSGLSYLKTNGGHINTKAHEVVVYATPVQSRNFSYDMRFNFSKMKNEVISLKDGVNSITLGGFVTPQVRLSVGEQFPVIYGTSFLRDDSGQIIVEDNPGSPTHGMPMTGEDKVIGRAAPDFILGHTSSFNYKQWSLSAVFEWKSGGQMYSGSNGLLDLYGLSERTGDRESTFVYPGVKPDGTPNDIVRGGDGDDNAYQTLWSGVLGNIDEHYIHDNDFVKLREIALSYRFRKPLYKTMHVGVNVFARNILLWSALENFDPESSQGNNNMGGAFERFSMPQTSSFGFGLDITF